MSTNRVSQLPLLLILVAALAVVGCGSQIPSGHRGVFYSKFGEGTQMGKIYDEGFTWHLPWNSMFVYQIQLQERKEALTVLSSDGATIRMEVSILYRPEFTALDSLQIKMSTIQYAHNDILAWYISQGDRILMT